MQVLKAKRSAIIAAIKEVESARAEDDWLTAYEADEQRYKVRTKGACCKVWGFTRFCTLIAARHPHASSGQSAAKRATSCVSSSEQAKCTVVMPQRPVVQR